MKKSSLVCHGVWQLALLLFCFEPILGSFDVYLCCVSFLFLIAIAIVLLICIHPATKMKEIIAYSGHVRLIYFSIFIFGMVVSYIYQSNLLHVWLFMIVNEFILWKLNRH